MSCRVKENSFDTIKSIFRKKEVLAVLMFGFFAVTWVFGLIPVLVSSVWFTTLIPPFQYILYNFGYYLMTVMFVYIPYAAMYKNEHVKLLTLLRSGLAQWILFSFVLDMLQPPMFLKTNGQVAITDSGALPGVSVDSMTAWLWQQVGIPNAPILFDMVYFITPIIAVIISVVLFNADSVWGMMGIEKDGIDLRKQFQPKTKQSKKHVNANYNPHRYSH